MTHRIRGTTRRLRVEQLTEEDAIVAVIGPSGAGKSSFINTATGSREPVDDLESCTREIGIIKFRSFDSSKEIVLIDTPGFNHEKMSNAEVLKVIADWLTTTYDRNIKLTGILYFQNLEAMTGAHRRNNVMVQRLCGKNALRNTIFTTTTWNKVDVALESKWENELVNGWEATIGQGFMFMRYRNTVDSAWDILDNLLQRKDRHATRLQTEMVDLGLQLHETAAGPSWEVYSRSAARPTFTAMKMLYENLSKRKEAITRYNASIHTVKSIAMEVDELSQDDVVIALMGPTGAGKSSFINMATGDDLGIGHDLESYTTAIRMVKVQDIILVDTPGFDDTRKTDTEILNMIANWLKVTYKRDIKLAGILYFHRISDNRMAGTPLKNLRIFEKLCGKKALPNVILMTTMWDKVNPEIGAKREHDLKSGCWKDMIKQGSKTVRYRNTYDSAWDILDIFVQDQRLAVLLQKEMVDMERQLRETGAGQELYKELEAMVKQLTEKLEKVRGANQAGSDDEYNLNAQLQNMAAEMQTLKISMGRRFFRYATSSFK